MMVRGPRNDGRIYIHQFQRLLKLRREFPSRCDKRYTRTTLRQLDAGNLENYEILGSRDIYRECGLCYQRRWALLNLDSNKSVLHLERVPDEALETLPFHIDLRYLY